MSRRGAVAPIRGPNDGRELSRDGSGSAPVPTRLSAALEEAFASGTLSHDQAQRLDRVRQAAADLRSAILGSGASPAAVAAAMRAVTATI